MSISYRVLNIDELERVREINRSDFSNRTYFFKEGTLVLEELSFLHPGFNSRALKKIVIELSRGFKNGDIFIGAFDGTILIGISGLENKFRGKDNDLINFGPMWVSKAYRQLGFGKHLFEMVKDKAKDMGAKMLYISATPSKNTIDFYLSIGCRLTSDIDEELYKKEPYDIHMEYEL